MLRTSDLSKINAIIIFQTQFFNNLHNVEKHDLPVHDLDCSQNGMEQNRVSLKFQFVCHLFWNFEVRGSRLGSFFLAPVASYMVISSFRTPPLHPSLQHLVSRFGLLLQQNCSLLLAFKMLEEYCCKIRRRFTILLAVAQKSWSHPTINLTGCFSCNDQTYL